jgi:hypothetical protein
LKIVLQIEFSPSLLEEREAILQRCGCQVISILNPNKEKDLVPAGINLGVVVIGHGAPWSERQDLVALLRKANPGVPIVTLLRSTDEPFYKADFNIPADNPPLWERTVLQALERLQ